MTTLHYIYDPLCGWCYGAAPLISAARAIPGLVIHLHGGGMMAGANRQAITPQLRSYVMAHDQRTEQLTGQSFGAAYFNDLLRDSSAVMDSAPPTTAILAAEALSGRGLDMLHRLQYAHYVQGRHIARLPVLAELATEMGLDPTAFAEAFTRMEGAATDRHFADSRNWLARIGGQGFPTFALEQANGTLELLDVGDWLSRPAAWADYLNGQLFQQGSTTPVLGNLACGIEGCST